MGFTDSARWHGSQTPAAKYPSVRLDLYKERMRSPRIVLKNEKPSDSREGWQIPKMNMPSPGQYNTLTSLQKVVWRKVRQVPKSTAPNESFVEKHSKLFKHVPAPNHYRKEKLDTGHDKTTNFIIDNTLRH